MILYKFGRRITKIYKVIKLFASHGMFLRSCVPGSLIDCTANIPTEIVCNKLFCLDTKQTW